MGRRDAPYRRLEQADSEHADPSEEPIVVSRTIGEALGFIHDKDSIAAKDGCYYVKGFPQWLWGIIFFLAGAGMFSWGSWNFSQVDDLLEKNMWAGCLCFLSGLIFWVISAIVCRFRSSEFDTMTLETI